MFVLTNSTIEKTFSCNASDRESCSDCKKEIILLFKVFRSMSWISFSPNDWFIWKESDAENAIGNMVSE